MSVDDLIAGVVRLVEGELGLAEHTYFVYTSDHGFQLGQFNILMDKRHVYDWNTRIHLLVRGPRIPPGTGVRVRVRVRVRVGVTVRVRVRVRVD